MRSPSNRAAHPPPPRTYRPTMLDRLGPDGALMLRAMPYMVVLFACLVLLFSTLRRQLEYPSALVLPLALGATAAISWAGMRFANAAGARFGHFVLPTGESTPYEHQFSREEALAARGDITGAIDALEAAIAAISIDAPTGLAVRIRTAELYMGQGANPKRAAELLREVQRHPGLPPTQDIYVSNRLIDLLLGPLAQPARALFELRRLADRYPASTAGKHARSAIATVKRQMSEAEPGARESRDPAVG